ncbi:hypothetical protein GCM10010510_67230 [Streptomyces anandii JCM 4720]|nr:hypothetical protein GCM10010510_67230 [Streptomyces anandii JCM 4720]
MGAPAYFDGSGSDTATFVPRGRTCHLLLTNGSPREGGVSGGLGAVDGEPDSWTEATCGNALDAQSGGRGRLAR